MLSLHTRDITAFSEIILNFIDFFIYLHELLNRVLICALLHPPCYKVNFHGLFQPRYFLFKVFDL